MPTLHFVRTRFEVDVPDGGRLLEVCDRDIRAGVPFSCRSANCGTCMLEVREGAALCEPPETDEAELLSYLRMPPTHRLGCQLSLRAGPGRVVLYVTL